MIVVEFGGGVRWGIAFRAIQLTEKQQARLQAGRYHSMPQRPKALTSCKVGRLTDESLFDYRFPLVSGTAFCSQSDTFLWWRGQELALVRAISHFGMEEIELFVNAYLRAIYEGQSSLVASAAAKRLAVLFRTEWERTNPSPTPTPYQTEKQEIRTYGQGAPGVCQHGPQASSGDRESGREGSAPEGDRARVGLEGGAGSRAEGWATESRNQETARIAGGGYQRIAERRVSAFKRALIGRRRTDHVQIRN